MMIELAAFCIGLFLGIVLTVGVIAYHLGRAEDFDGDTDE